MSYQYDPLITEAMVLSNGAGACGPQRGTLS